MTACSGIFACQHPIFKWIFCLLFSGCLIIASPVDLALLFALSIIYFLIYPSIFIYWLDTVLKLMPLFIALILMAVIMKQDIFRQLLLLARICLLLLLSVYLVKTAPPYRLFSFIPLKHNQTRQFLTATFLFIPLFIDRFSQFKANKIWSEHLLDKAFLATRAEIANIRAAIDQMDESQTANYSLMADLYGIIALLAVCAIILF